MNAKRVLVEHSKGLQSISADFEELVYSYLFDVPIKASGKLLYENENSCKIRWEHFLPKSKIILIDGSSFRIQDQGVEINNSSAKRVMGQIQKLMLSLFSGSFLNEKRFNVTFFENDKQYKYVLSPKKQSYF